MHTNFMLEAPISPQWLSQLRQLGQCMRACFRIGSHTMPGQRHSPLTLTLLGQECMHVFIRNLPPELLAE